MSFDYSKLRGRIIEKYGSQKKFAEALSTTEKTVTFKMNGYTPFKQSEIIEWCTLLDIDIAEAHLFFLNQS